MLQVKFGDDTEIKLSEQKFLVYLINNKNDKKKLKHGGKKWKQKM